MKVPYDKYYLKEDYFGHPLPGLVDFFKACNKNYHILDLGCGQGRDSLMLGSMGYKVTGVDISSVGINQLNDKAKRLRLNVKGIVGNLYEFSITDDYDIILMDSILHFYKHDMEKETALVKKVLNDMKRGAIFCNCMISGKKREKLLEKIIAGDSTDFKNLYDSYSEYPDFNMQYHINIVKKGEL